MVCGKDKHMSKTDDKMENKEKRKEQSDELAFIMSKRIKDDLEEMEEYMEEGFQSN